MQRCRNSLQKGGRMSEKTHSDYWYAISQSGFDIYAVQEVGHPDYWIPTPQIQQLLNDGLVGLSLSGLALRTRSKVVKQEVCKALGYPVPESFRKTQPRFLGQQLDIYTQKSRNLQIWNEELSPNRRYAIIAISEDDIVCKVTVINGQELALLDNTGTITTKYQARFDTGDAIYELVNEVDTDSLVRVVTPLLEFNESQGPTDLPERGYILPIEEIFTRLQSIVGERFPDPGIDQERNRGAELHKLVCERLGYRSYGDLGVFPDVRHQLLEVKLQTSPTIDLGLVLPTSEEKLDISGFDGIPFRYKDTRYAVFCGTTDGNEVEITHLVVSSGESFFKRFVQFGGKEINGKIQIPLPAEFFT